MTEIFIQTGLFVFGVLSVVLLVKKNKRGFVVGLLSQPFWFAAAIATKQWGLLLINFIYTGVFILGIYEWFFKNKSEKSNPRIGVGVIVVKNDKVLLGKRKNSHGEATWGFPGGHLEYGESWEDCASREVAEEVGLEISDISFLTATNDIFSENNKHYNTIFMLARHKLGEARLLEPQKCEEWKWFSWDDLPRPLFLPIENLLKRNFSPFK